MFNFSAYTTINFNEINANLGFWDSNSADTKKER